MVHPLIRRLEVSAGEATVTDLLSRHSWQSSRFAWEDFDFWCCLIDVGQHGVLCPRLLATHVVHGDSMPQSTTNRDQRRLSRLLRHRHPWMHLPLAMTITERVRSRLRRLRQRLPGSRPHAATPPPGNGAEEAGAAAVAQELEGRLSGSDQLAVFVRYEQGDDLPDCQAAFLADLARRGWLVWIVDNSPKPLAGAWRQRSGCTLYWQRQNRGMCIGAYADAIGLLARLMERKATCEPPTLALMNNSFLPLLPPSANPVLRQLFSPLPADHFRGLTESREQAYHLQSYLLVLGYAAWHSAPARAFWQRCRELHPREQIISEGEVALTGALLAAGLTSEVMIPLSRLAGMEQTAMGIQEHHPVSPIEHNPYLVYWKELLQLTGIVKKSALNNASQSRTARATLAEFMQVARRAGLPGAAAAIDRLVRH